MRTRFAFDLGTNSLGWAVYEVGDRVPPHGKRERDVPISLVTLGAKIYSDGRVAKTKQSLAEIRRIPRGARRRRDRFLQRRRYVMALLQKHDLLPTAGKTLDELMQSDPYPLRAVATRSKVSKHQLGRIMVHLNQRRGFKSNRKAPSVDDETNGKIATGADKLRLILESQGFNSVGEFLASRQAYSDVRKRIPVRVRMNVKDPKTGYEFYPLRDMVETEFDLICQEQLKYHQSLSPIIIDKIRHAIFWQRPLRPVDPGRCSFFPDEPRLADAYDDAQAFRIYQMLNNLRLVHQSSQRKLSLDERDRLADSLMNGRDLTWMQVRKILAIDSSYQINLEEGGEKKLIGNLVAQRMIGTKKKPGPFRDTWSNLSALDRDTIVSNLRDAEEDKYIVEWAMAMFELSSENASLLAAIRLPDSYRKLSKKAVDMILYALKQEVIVFSDAVDKCGLHHSDLDHGEHYNRLPMYNKVPSLQRFLGKATGDPKDPPDERYGRIGNPTVHIGLNQLRRTVNALIDRYGRPEQIVVEVARELKQSQKQKDLVQKRNLQNRDANDRRRDELYTMGKIEKGDKRIGAMLLRLKLWEELGDHPRRCPYTSAVIGQEALFSDEIEIEHILPYSRTLDNSPANLTVAFRVANRIKTNMSPAEAAVRHPDVIKLDEMLAQVRQSSMPKNKKWRFEVDAMDRYENEEEFLARQLHETQFLSRMARSYLSKLFPKTDDDGFSRQRVWVVPGKMTSLLRSRFGVNPSNNNSKNRNDHRHHAIDAAIIGITDRSLIQRLSTIAARDEQNGLDRVLADIPAPFDGFREQVMSGYEKLLVGGRAKHVRNADSNSRSTSCKLHEDTQYGLVKDIPENAEDLAIGNVVRRKAVVDLTAKEIGQVRDLAHRTALRKVLCIDENTGKSSLLTKEWKNVLISWSESSGIRRLRLLKPEKNIIPIVSQVSGKEYKGVVPDGNMYIDFYDDGGAVWKATAMDSFRVHQKGVQSSRMTGEFVMRLHKGDYVQIRDLETGLNSVKQVHQLKISSGQIFLADANEGGKLNDRHNDVDDAFRWDMASISKLKQRATRRVRFTNAGRMKVVPYGKYLFCE